MSEFQSDITDKKYDEEGNELDKHGFKVKRYPDGMESVRIAVQNAEMLCGLQKSTMEKLLKAEWSEVTTLDSRGRTSKKIMIEYDVKEKKE